MTRLSVLLLAATLAGCGGTVSVPPDGRTDAAVTGDAAPDASTAPDAGTCAPFLRPPSDQGKFCTLACNLEYARDPKLYDFCTMECTAPSDCPAGFVCHPLPVPTTTIHGCFFACDAGTPCPNPLKCESEGVCD